MSKDDNSLSYIATAAVSGGLFGLGLYVSQMVDPLKVLRFLDVGAIPSGGWDPSLAFVIVPAILVAFIGNRFAKGLKAPLFKRPFPSARSQGHRCAAGSRRGAVRHRLGHVGHLPRSGDRADRLRAAQSAGFPCRPCSQAFLPAITCSNG
nr:DUF6691 family protein [uncultured Sphaerochaeta sp.]